VFVHPGTLPEPFGLTVIEAMQHETVPVVSDCGAPPWIVGDAGLTFEWTDESDLADRLEELSDDTVLNAYAARCSRNFVASNRKSSVSNTTNCTKIYYDRFEKWQPKTSFIKHL